MKIPGFIVGVGRSGTTLLRAHVDAYSQITVPGEAPFMPRLRDYLQANTIIDRKAVIRGLKESPFFSGWALPDIEVEQALRHDRPQQVINDLYAAYAHKLRAEFLIDNTPGNILLMEQLSKAFPEARFVHLVRDPRAVVASSLMPDWYSSVELAAINYYERVKSALESEQQLPGRVLRIYYEDMVRDPQRVVAQFLNYFEIPADHQPRHDQARKHVESTLTNQAWHQHLWEPVTDRNPTLIEQLSDEDIATIDNVVAPLYDELPYERLSKTQPTKADGVRREELSQQWAEWRAEREAQRLQSGRLFG